MLGARRAVFPARPGLAVAPPRAAPAARRAMAPVAPVLGVATSGLQYLGNLPPEVRVVALTAEGPLPEGTPDITFLVASRVELLPDRLKQILAAATQIKVRPAARLGRTRLATSPGLLSRSWPDGRWCAYQVVQTLSAGVDVFTHLVPPHVVLCSASGAHDIPVADWCAAGRVAPSLVLCWPGREQAARFHARVSLHVQPCAVRHAYVSG